MFNKKWAILLAVMIIASLVLSACAPAEPQVIEKVVKETVVVEKEVVVEKAVKETVVVEKEVVVEVEKEVAVEVEKEVVVTATPLPTEDLITLDWNYSTEPPTLDPALAEDTTSHDITENLFLALMGFDDKGNIYNELATEWSTNDAGDVYTFKMRQDTQWIRYNPATGSIEELGPVTAHDVEYGIKRTLDPRTASGYAYVLYIIKGAEALNTADIGALSDEEVQALLDGVGVKALDDYTVEITLESPAGYFLGIVSMWVASPMPQAVIEEKGERWIEPGFIVTNGPYMLSEWAHDDHLTLIKNPLYYDADKVQIEKIYGVMVTESSTAMSMYEADELDSTAPPLEDMDRIKADPVLSAEYFQAPYPCTYYYGFTNDKPPMDNKLVRKAFSAAIDRVALVENVTKGGQVPANSFTTLGLFGSFGGDPDVAPWALDYEVGLAKAKEWMAEAGYPDGEGFPTITLMHNTSEGHKKIAEAIAAMWKEALNVDIKIENQEWKVYLNTISKDTPVEEMPHVWRLGWCADYPDANNWVNEVFNPKLRNDIRWDNKEFQEAVEKAAVSSDPDERLALYKRAEQILCDEEAAIAPIYFYTTVNLTKPWLTRNYPGISGKDFWNWKIDWEAKKAALGL